MTLPGLARVAFLVLMPLLSACSTAPLVRTGAALETNGGAVACEDRYAAEIGARVLARGGHAVDAAVAMAFALAVTWPPAGNLAGGGVMLVREADGQAVAIDMRETAPAAVDAHMFLDEHGRYDPARALDPWLCFGVPGSVRGLGLAHARYGRLDWQELLQPALELARDGFVVDEMLARFLAGARDGLAAVPASAELFLDRDGQTLGAGTRLIQADLARTLHRLAVLGPDDLYEGGLARRLIEDVQRHGGVMLAADLARYEPILREPLRLPYRGAVVLAMPPPSSGGIALGQILGQLQRLDADLLPPRSVPARHAYAEAARRAFAERARHLGDPDHVHVPVEAMLAPEHLDQLAASISPDTATPSETLGPALIPTEGEDTTHLSVIDAQGNAVSFTTTLEANCGGKAVAAGTGMLLNNQLRDFNRIPGRTTNTGLIGTTPNLAGPFRRPVTSMTPVIVMQDGLPVLVTGSPGGRTIINTVAQVVMAVIGRGTPLPNAVAAPRVHHQWFPDALHFEAGTLDDELAAALVSYGHALVEKPATGPVLGTQGSANSVGIDPSTGRRTAAADPRRDGHAAVADTSSQ